MCKSVNLEKHKSYHVDWQNDRMFFEYPFENASDAHEIARYKWSFGIEPDASASTIGSRSKRVETAGNNDVSLILQQKAPKNGWAYVYVSNESDENVYFDNLAVTHEHGRIVEENHYYPFGGEIAALSSKAFNKLENPFTYQGAFNEKESNTNLHEFDLRTYDPQIGRWISGDPLSQYASPYNAFGNDPLNNLDPSGGWAGGMNAGVGIWNTAVGWGLIGGTAAGVGVGLVTKDKDKAAVAFAAGFGLGVGAYYVNWDAIGSKIENGWDFFQQHPITYENVGLIGLAETPGFGRGADYHSGNDFNDLPDETMRSYSLRQLTNEQLIDKMQSTMEFYSRGELENIALIFMRRFLQNSRGEFENERLSQITEKDERTKDFLNQFTLQLAQEFMNNNYKLPVDPVRYDGGAFYDDKFEGTGIIIHGTQGFEIYLDKFKYDPKTRMMSVNYHYRLYDDFGVDRHDVTSKKWAPYADGLYAWYILQNQRGFQPFVSRLTGSYQTTIVIEQPKKK